MLRLERRGSCFVETRRSEEREAGTPSSPSLRVGRKSLLTRRPPRASCAVHAGVRFTHTRAAGGAWTHRLWLHRGNQRSEEWLSAQQGARTGGDQR